ncbi:hypothetical protein F7725_014709 [Dissostichus mawsoni]|uniref:Uncharacterized protein n=1 Tax=Dissostichus mawsoni TaxID=36200 RepID=A0A7J5YYZ5_DISMA|nr:hypothetical protein F7725_014709 [Dissostichus mawsoni]
MVCHSDQETQTDFSEAKQDDEKTQPETETKKPKGTTKYTQTPVVCQRPGNTDRLLEAKQDDEKTQPETEEKKQDTPEAKTQNTAQTQLKQNANKDNDKAASESTEKQNPENESKSKEENPSAGAEPKSYAKVVSGEGGSQKQSNVEASKAADKNKKTPKHTGSKPSETSTRCSHVHRSHLCSAGQKSFTFTKASFIVMRSKVSCSLLVRWWVGRIKSVAVSEAWQASAGTLLNRIFQKWILSDKQSTERLLSFCTWKNRFIDNSQPPMIKTSELIAETLVQILKGEPKEKVPGSWRSSSPLIQGLSVFVVSQKRQISLGVKGYAELCLLVSSETSMDKENLEGLLGHFPNPQFMVLALMNRCAQSMVSELVLLLPLLFRLRQPGADANKVGPSVEEANWSGLESVYYRPFRENIQSHLTKGSECVSKHPYFPKTDDAFLFKKNT